MNRYKENGEKQQEKLNEKIEIKDVFEQAKKIETESNKEIITKELPVVRKSLFRKIIDFFESKIFE